MILSLLFITTYIVLIESIVDKQEKRIFNMIFLTSMVFAVFSYYWVPKEHYDLAVYRFIADNFSVFSVKDSFFYLFSRGEYLSMFYFLITSFFSDRAIIQVFPVFITYFLLFKLLWQFYLEYKPTKSIYIMVVLYYLANFKYIMVISGIRFWLATVIFVVILRKVEASSISKKWFLLPLLIHNSIILFIGLYFLAQLPLKRLLQWVVGGFAAMTIIANIIPIFIHFPLDGDTTLITFINKYILYFSFRFNVTNQFILLLGEVLLALFTLFYAFKNKLLKDTRWVRLAVVVTLVSVLSVGNYDLIKRMFELGRLLMLPIYLITCNHWLTNYRKKGERIYLLPVAVLLILTIAGVFVQFRIWQIDILPLVQF